MPCWLAHDELLVLGRYAFDRRRREPLALEGRVRRPQVLDHQIEAGACGCDLRLGDEHQMRAATQLQDRELTPEHDWSHPERSHKTLGLFEPIGFEYDMSDPYGRALILLTHRMPSSLAADRRV